MNKLKTHWSLDESVDYLNHGSFGAAPIEVLEHQADLRRRLEREPVRFFNDFLPPALDEVRQTLAEFLSADPDGLVLVPNATTAVNTVLKSLVLSPGDELLTTDHAYVACKNALDYVAEKSGARVIVARIPFPVQDEVQVIEAIMQKVSERTRFALIDHITSVTALILPIEKIVARLKQSGVRVMVDGAHAPGMVPLNLGRINADYYTGNCHKWLCTPKGAAFLHTAAHAREELRPLVISHGAQAPKAARYLAEFAWVGTSDPTAYLCVGTAIRFMGGLLKGGWPSVWERMHEGVCSARGVLTKALSVPPGAPDEMVGAMVSLPIFPRTDRLADSLWAGAEDPLGRLIFEQARIEVPIIVWPKAGERLVRISFALYNSAEQYARLAKVLLAMCAESDTF